MYNEKIYIILVKIFMIDGLKEKDDIRDISKYDR